MPAPPPHGVSPSDLATLHSVFGASNTVWNDLRDVEFAAMERCQRAGLLGVHDPGPRPGRHKTTLYLTDAGKRALSRLRATRSNPTTNDRATTRARRRLPRHGDTMPSPRPKALTPLQTMIFERAQRRILAGMQRGIVPEDVRSFSQLHDFVDANVYLLDRHGNFDPGVARRGPAFATVLNAVIDRLDTWLATRRPARRR